MKLTRALSASVLVGAVLFSATACSPASDSTSSPAESAIATPTEGLSAIPSPDPRSTETTEEVTESATSETEESETEEVDMADVEVEEAANTVSAYYDFASSEGALDQIKAVSDSLTPETTDVELQEIVNSFPEGFAFFDTSSPEKIKNALSQLYARATQSERHSEVLISVLSEAIKVNGDSATVDSSKVLVTADGTTGPVTEAPYFELAQINLVKKTDGSWGIVPEAPRQTIP